MTMVLRRVLWNPILAREVRSRMRSARAPGVLTVFLALVGGVAFVTYTSGTGQSVGLNAGTAAGPRLFQALGGTVVGLVVLLAPGICAPAISSERERQTLDLMLCTRMRATTIVVGKLLASLLFMLVLIVATVPILSMVFLLGGVDPASVLIVLVIAMATALVAGSIGLFCSALLRRSAAATLATYVLMALLVLVPILATVPGFGGRGGSPSLSCLNSICAPGEPPGRLTQIITAASPLTATAATLDAYTPGRVVCDDGGGQPFGSPLGPVGLTAPGFPISSGPIGLIGPGGVPSAPTCRELTRGDADIVAGGLFRNWHIWQASLVVDAVVVPLLLAGTVLLVRGRRPGLTLPRWRRRRDPVGEAG